MRRATLIGVIYPSFLIIIVITVLILSFSATHTVRNLLYQQTTLRLEETGRLLVNLIDETKYPYGPQIDHICSSLSLEEFDMRIILYKADGSILRSNQLIETETIKAKPVEATRTAFRGTESTSITKGESSSIDRMYYALPIRNGENILGAIETSLPLEIVNTSLNRTFTTIVIVSLVMLLFSVILSYYISIRIDRPLKKIAAAARRYRNLDFSTHPHISSPEEIRVVSEALRNMSSALQERLRLITHQKQELRTILNGMEEAVLLLDGELFVREINPAGEILFNISYKSIVGKSLIHAIRNTELYDLASEALSGDQSIERTMSMPEELGPATLSSIPSARAGRLIHLQVHASVVSEEIVENEHVKRVKRLVLVLNDITKMKNLERIRRDFVANVSHELKTPITSIKGFTETLLEGALEDRETSRTFISIIREQSERLVAIIEDLLSLSRLEQQEEPERETTNTAAIANGALQVCKNTAEEKHIDISIQCSKEGNIYGNALLIEQALVNLIDNAVKYSPVSSSVVVESREHKGGTFLSVRDNGPGIPRKDLSRIFERFYRVDKTRSRELGGTGLGLAIVKHIALSHGGEVSVESREGEGTEFFLFFPAKKDLRE